MTQNTTLNGTSNATTALPALQSLYTRIQGEGDQRMDFFPKHFGAQFMIAENLLFELARKTMPDYKSGYWEFALTTSEHTPFMFLHTEGKPVRMHTLFGDNESELPAELAGIVLTMLVHLLLVQGVDRYRLNDYLHDKYLERYHELRHVGYDMAAACGATEAFHRLID